MAVINVNRDEVRLVRTDLEGATFGPANAAIDEGRFVSQNAQGRYAHGGSTGGVAFTRAIRSRYTVSVIKRGLLELGAALQSVAIGTKVFTDPTTGQLHDADGTNFVPVGSVEGHNLNDRNVARRLLRVNV